MNAFAAAQNCAALMHNGTSNFCEEDLAPCIAESHNTNNGVHVMPGMMWARHAVAGSSGKSNVQVCVDCTWSSLGRHAMMGLLASCTLVTGALVVRKLLVVPESKMACLLMISMSILTVQRSAVAASAYWVGIGQEGNKLWFNLILLLLSTPACQKLYLLPLLLLPTPM